jgi:dihydrofolate synthase/folylpolyglutamate synthase
MNSKAAFSCSADVFAWISRFINLERGQGTKSFGLDRMKVLSALAGHPERAAPVIHIAGSKGKGSVTGMITAVLEASGLKTARYSSPHVTEYRERIMAGNDFFDESIYVEAGGELVSVAAMLRKAPKGSSAENTGMKDRGKAPDLPHDAGEEPTFFELLTLFFFLCARRSRCDIMVVETGMGGRLDATNIVDPLLSVITSIELEHTDYLGDTISAIAGEKAGIIKPGKPLILAEQEAEALAVFIKTAEENHAPLCYFPDMAAIDKLRIHRNGVDFTLIFKRSGFFSSPLDMAIPIPGEVQAKNAGLAVLALKTAFPSIGAETIRAALGGFRLPARFETICRAPRVIIDGAHTPKSIAYCVKTFTALYGKGGILLFGCADGKDAESMAKVLVPHFSHIIITTPGTFKVSYPEKVYGIFKKEANPEDRGLIIELMKETKAAVQRAFELGRAAELPVLGTGSFYLASEIRASVRPGLAEAENRGILN